MKIIDITPETEKDYFCCLEEWSEDFKDAGECKQKWYSSMKNQGLKVKLALDDNDIIGGMIQYIPSEYSFCEGKNLYVVLCLWVHGHKKGRGDYRKRGMGKALLKAAEEDTMKMGADGLVAWGLIIPVFMRVSWFKKHGYKVVDKSGIMRLLWKPFNESAIPPLFRKPERRPEKGKDKVNITMYRNGWCQSVNITCERAKRASLEFPGKINLQEIDTSGKEALLEYGITDALYIDGKEVFMGPPISFEKIKRKIEKRVRKIF